MKKILLSLILGLMLVPTSAFAEPMSPPQRDISIAYWDSLGCFNPGQTVLTGFGIYNNDLNEQTFATNNLVSRFTISGARPTTRRILSSIELAWGATTFIDGGPSVLGRPRYDRVNDVYYYEVVGTVNAPRRLLNEVNYANNSSTRRFELGYGCGCESVAEGKVLTACSVSSFYK